MDDDGGGWLSEEKWKMGIWRAFVLCLESEWKNWICEFEENGVSILYDEKGKLAVGVYGGGAFCVCVWVFVFLFGFQVPTAEISGKS